MVWLRLAGLGHRSHHRWLEHNKRKGVLDPAKASLMFVRSNINESPKQEVSNTFIMVGKGVPVLSQSSSTED